MGATGHSPRALRANVAPSLVGFIAWVVAAGAPAGTSRGARLPARAAGDRASAAGALPGSGRTQLVNGRIAGWPALIAALPWSSHSACRAVSPGCSAPLAGHRPLAAVAASPSGIGRVCRTSARPRPATIPDLGLDAALAFWAVGAIFVLVDRLGIATPFPTVIVLLTATHFHFAGLGLLGLASLLARSRPGSRVSVVGLIAGIPLTALGFVSRPTCVNSLGAGWSACRASAWAWPS